MASSSYAWVRYVVGTIYLLKGAFVATIALLLLFAGSAAVFLGDVRAPEGAMLFVLMAILGVWATAYGALGIGLIKGNRIALFLAILFAGLGAIGALTTGAVVPFFLEAGICAGLLMSKDVRQGYAD